MIKKFLVLFILIPHLLFAFQCNFPIYWPLDGSTFTKQEWDDLIREAKTSLKSSGMTNSQIIQLLKDEMKNYKPGNYSYDSMVDEANKLCKKVGPIEFNSILNCVEKLHTKEANVEKKEESIDNNQNILNLDVNPETNNMINDIVSMFQNGMEGGEDANPFKNIVEVTKKITENYQGKIEKGDIDLDGLLKSIQKTLPDMPDISKLDLDGKSEEEIKHIIDEKFSASITV